MRLILYSKPGCHLCEGLQEKLEEIVQKRNFESLQLEVRDITTRDDWLHAYQYEVPVLFLLNHQNGFSTRGSANAQRLVREASPTGEEKDAKGTEQLLPRPSPRATVLQLEQMLRKYL